MTAATIAVRMYNVGFGDSFLITLTGEDAPWRMLIDCGVHSQGRARSIEESVNAIIGDLAAAAPDGQPHLDVIAATHHHADHISGFSLAAWEAVQVDEVWLPFVEDAGDPDARSLRRRQTETAHRLIGLIEQRTLGLGQGQWPAAVRGAQWFAVNSFGNADATDRLVGRNGQRFAGDHRVRYLPSLRAADNTITLAGGAAVAHVLGPSRDPEQLSRMDPPRSAGWLRLDLDDPTLAAEDLAGVPLFDRDYVVDERDDISDTLQRAQGSLNLGKVTNDAGLLRAASILERAVNNTSLFLVLDVAGTRLVFPGDAQEGAWQHVLQNPAAAALLHDAAFYKVGHHGSHNATPKQFVEHVWQAGGYAMLPWALVKRWRDTIPKRELLDALHRHQHTVIRADAPEAVPGKVTVHEDLWSEIVFPVGVR
jgi:beta-lactamase superfamily II metal-dependent hydrolase